MKHIRASYYSLDMFVFQFRKMTRKAVPSSNWLRVGYLFIRLISMIDDERTEDCSSVSMNIVSIFMEFFLFHDYVLCLDENGGLVRC